MTQTILSPLVGVHFRPAGKLILGVLQTGTVLHLDPDPTNPYDTSAIKVLLVPDEADVFEDSKLSALEESLPSYGLSLDEFLASGFYHLGFIAAKFPKALRGFEASGYLLNMDVLPILAGEPDYSAELAFAPNGEPLVKITYENGAST